MDGWMDGTYTNSPWMDGWMEEWMDTWMDGLNIWKHGWMDGIASWIHKLVITSAIMHFIQVFTWSSFIFTTFTFSFGKTLVASSSILDSIKMGEFTKEYREMLQEMMRNVNEGSHPDQMALDKLKGARNALVHCKNKAPRGEKRKRVVSDQGRAVRLHAIFAIWRKMLREYTSLRCTEHDAFQKAFTRDGQKGYKKFFQQILEIAFESLKGEDGLSDEDKEIFKNDWEKPKGWLAQTVMDMDHQIWQLMVDNLKGDDDATLDILGNVGWHKSKKMLLKQWSKELMAANAEGNNRYGSKVVQIGDLTITGKMKGSRPSRVVQDVRSLHFLRPEQIRVIGNVGKGVQGEVVTCNILDCPLIRPETVVVAKIFKGKNKEQQRRDALQEMLMGGLNHKGIVGAFAITIEYPPRLVYDFYNGGSLASMYEKIEKDKKGKAALKDARFASQKSLFLENRLGLAFALLETMAALHDVDRIHADLHDANILLHFDHNDDIAIKVYIGMCDFGMSKDLSQCGLPVFGAMPEDKVEAYRRKFPALAPELVGPDPSFYSKATDVYALGNCFESLLQAPDGWDGLRRAQRMLDTVWDAHFMSPRLDDIIKQMMHINPKERKDCNFWILRMMQSFPKCALRMRNSQYLRD